MVVRLDPQFVQGHADLGREVTAFGQEGGEQLFLDVAVADPFGPVAEIAVAQFSAKQTDHPVLGGAFRLADDGHSKTSQ